MLGVAANFGLAQGNDPPPKNPGGNPLQSNQPPNPGNQPGDKQPFLGVALEPLPPGLANQMPGVIPQGQGIVITGVVPDSPAAKAGLRERDIVLSVDNQKIHSPDELINQVRKSKSGQQVEISYVRAGKAETCKATLADRPIAMNFNPNGFPFRPDERARQMWEEAQARNDEHVWESFDALKLTRLDDKRWRAEIDYRGKDQKKEHKSFEGTLQEIRKNVRAEKDLPQNERTHLLRALSPNGPMFEFPNQPFGPNGNLR
jgi:hypothetical protein